MKVIIRLRDKALSDKIAKSFEPIAKIKGNKVYNLPTDKHLTQRDITLLFFEALPYVVDNYVLIEDKGRVTVFELIDNEWADFNPHLVEKLSGFCAWKKFKHYFSRSDSNLLERLAGYMEGRAVH